MRILTALLFMFASLSADPLSAEDGSAEALAAKLEEFDRFAREFRIENTVLSMSYAIVVDGKIVAAQGIGWQDHDAEEPTTADTSYLAASITKTSRSPNRSDAKAIWLPSRDQTG